MKNLKIALAVFVVLFFAGCLESNNKKADIMKETAPEVSADSESTDFEYDKYIFENPYKYERTSMAWKVFQETLTTGKNHVYSPISLEVVLTLLMQASSGKSRSS